MRTARVCEGVVGAGDEASDPIVGTFVFVVKADIDSGRVSRNKF